MWWRPEAFGAWVRLGDETLLAVDHGLRARLGLEPAREHAGIPMPLEVHVAATARCDAGCPDCYLDAGPAGFEPPLERLFATLTELSELGVSTVAFGGGEPMMRPDLGELARAARRLGMVPVTTTSGRHLGEHSIEDLAAFAQVNVSHDGSGDGLGAAEHAMASLARAGVRVGVNVVLSAGNLPGLGKVALRLRELGVQELQLLRFKPVGRGLARVRERELDAQSLAALCDLVREMSESSALAVRIDCSTVPLLHDLLAQPAQARRLTAAGLFGCEAGRHLAAVDVRGRLLPCSCWPTGSEWGSWQRSGELLAVRAWHEQLAEPCGSCSLRTWCRGGCQVVSRAVHGRFCPDPGCPRVKSHTAADRGALAR